jgi:hypothetical protein
LRRHLPVLLLLVFAVILLSPLIFGGQVFFFRDFGRYYGPVKEVCLDQMRSGEFPLWLPELNCGTPVHGELVHALLYPGNLFLFLGESVGWGLYFAFHIFIAGLGARVLARRFGAGEAGAFAAGLAYAGSGYLVAQMNHVPYATAAAWIPLVIELGLRTGDGSRRATPLLALTLAVTALAGEPFTILLGLVILMILIMAGYTESRKRAILHLGIAGFVALLLASPALVPALEVLPQSMRAEGAAPDDPTYGSIHPIRLMTLLIPEALGRQQVSFDPFVHIFGKDIFYSAPVLTHLHLGALTLLGVLAMLFRRRRGTIALLATFMVAVLFSLGAYLGLSTSLAKYIPGLSLFRYPDKYWFVATLTASVILGVALPLLGKRSGVTAIVLGGLASLFALYLGRFSGTAWTATLLGGIPFLLCGAVLLLRPRGGPSLLIAILFLDLLVHGLRTNATIEPEMLRRPDGIAPLLIPLRPSRIFVDFKDDAERVRRGVRPLIITAYNALESNVGITRGIAYSFGYDPVEPSARLALYFGLDSETPPQWITWLRHRLLRLASNSHSITNADLKKDPAVVQVIQGPEGISAYKYRDPAARARLCGTTRVVRTIEEARELTHKIDFDPYNVLVIEDDQGASIDLGKVEGTVKFQVDEPRFIRLEVTSDRPAWLCLADTWFDGWHATVRGHPEKIRPALVAFRAVPVPMGKSIVEFHYEPGWLGVVPFTFVAGVLGLLGLLLPLVLELRRSRAGPPGDSPPSAS